MVGTEIGTGIDAILGGNDWGGAGFLRRKGHGECSFVACTWQRFGYTNSSVRLKVEELNSMAPLLFYPQRTRGNMKTNFAERAGVSNAP